MKKSTHIPTDSIEKQHYKKSYLQRKVEEKEAENAIRQFRQSSGQEEVPEAPGVDEKRPV